MEIYIFNNSWFVWLRCQLYFDIKIPWMILFSFIVVFPEVLSDFCNENDNWMICELCDMTQKPQFMILVECLFTELVVVAIIQCSCRKVNKRSTKSNALWHSLYSNNILFSSRSTNISLYGKVSYLVILHLKPCYESTLIRFFKDWLCMYLV